jgi:hypothetical protein
VDARAGFQLLPRLVGRIYWSLQSKTERQTSPVTQRQAKRAALRDTAGWQNDRPQMGSGFSTYAARWSTRDTENDGNQTQKMFTMQLDGTEVISAIG